MNNSILDATPNNLQHFMLMVVHQVQQQEDAWPFLHAVSPEEVPDYHDIIKVSLSPICITLGILFQHQQIIVLPAIGTSGCNFGHQSSLKVDTCFVAFDWVHGSCPATGQTGMLRCQ